MSSILAFDMETVPDTRAGRRLYGLEQLPDKDVARAMRHRRAQRTGQNSLALHQHRVVAISVALEGEAGLRLWTLGQPEDSEREIIRGFFQLIEDYTPQLTSWNGNGFDLPVLHYRCLVHALQAPRYWAMSNRTGSLSSSGNTDSGHIDLMQVLSGFRRAAAVPLDEFAAMLGLPGLPRMDAGRIWDLFLDGELEEIRRYCRLEVADIYTLYLRFQFMRGALSESDLKRKEESVRGQLAEGGGSR